MIVKNWLPVQRLDSLSYGSVTSYLSDEDLLSFLNWLSRHNRIGSFVAFQIAYMYCFGKQKAFANFKDLFKSILVLSPLLICEAERIDAMDSYRFQEVVGSLLKDGNESEFAKILASRNELHYAKVAMYYGQKMRSGQSHWYLLKNIWKKFGLYLVQQFFLEI